MPKLSNIPTEEMARAIRKVVQSLRGIKSTKVYHTPTKGYWNVWYCYFTNRKQNELAPVKTILSCDDLAAPVMVDLIWEYC